MKKVIIYGAGEFGSLISNIISYHSEINIVAYGDDDSKKIGQVIDGVPVFGNEELLNFARENEIQYAISSIGNNNIRADKYTLLKDKGFQMLSIVHPQALIDTKVTYGDNVIIEMGTAIHTESNIGNNVF